MLNNVASCPNCNKIFIKSERDLCRECHHKEEQVFLEVYRFMSSSKNRESTMEEISTIFNISTAIIIRWMKEGRFKYVDSPYLVYDCEKCKKPIKKNRLCDSCIQEIRTFIKQEETKKEKGHQASYHTMRQSNVFNKK